MNAEQLSTIYKSFLESCYEPEEKHFFFNENKVEKCKKIDKY